MITKTERFLRACRGETVDRPPVWLMRQAGRYLPEYRKVREGIAFFDFCRDVERAVEVSLQPLDLVGTEAVILFSDIFVPIPAMGVKVDFAPGPVIAAPIRSRGQVDALTNPDPRESVPFVFEILRRLRSELEGRSVPLLGFAGAPFTLAAYLVEGAGSRNFSALKTAMHREEAMLRALLDHLAEGVIAYARAQIEAGAQAFQLFDTWAGLLSREEYAIWIQPQHRRVAEALADSGVPTILYVGNGAHVVDCMADTGFDVISLDWRVDLGRAARKFGDRVSLQGNLDPGTLAASPETIRARVGELREAGRSARGHILNLGHGCLPETPVEGVRAFTDAVRSLQE